MPWRTGMPPDYVTWRHCIVICVLLIVAARQRHGDRHAADAANSITVA